MAVHAVVQQAGTVLIAQETAWAAGERFVSKGNWAMYFRHTVGVCQAVCPVGPEAVLLAGYRVSFSGASHDAASNTTTFVYLVRGQGATKALSHFTLGLSQCADVAGASPSPFTQGTDPTTGVTGIKWDLPLATTGSRVYTVTLEGKVPAGVGMAAVKAGLAVPTGAIAGPDDCGCR